MKRAKGFRSIFLVIVLTMVTTLAGNQSVFAYTVGDDGEPVHEYISNQARALYTNAEINAYIDTIKSGAEHEDLHDHIWDYYGFAGACVTLTHFWNADGGPNDPVSVGGCNGHNAWEKAQVLWGMAVGEYNSGDLTSAYEYLGHVTHLLADMSLPAHAHEEAHGPEPFDDDSYEDWMTLAEAELKDEDDEPAALLALGPVVIPDNVDPLYYLFYTTNQVADFFPDDSNDGDTVDNHGGWMGGIYTELGMNSITKPKTAGDLTENDNGDNNDDGDLGVIRDKSFKYAIRAVAALYELFTESVSGRPALTVVIDGIEAQDCHDETAVGGARDADFFVRVSISDVQQNEFWFRNEGDQVGNEQSISPGWAFARDVGLSGSVRIVIQVWDEDDDGTPEGADDKSDIDPGGGEDLDFDVNLATGEISGDITGTCDTQLTSIGNDDSSDQSRIYFTVILPNIPPTAHAGDDQTVNEGDTVTLEGTFTDPNIGDTHTYLWHMESSTNGQVIPDSSGPASPDPATQPFSFVPCDNGVYTFSFTVTDNYGAEGSDEVVVTVLNVPPVVSAPYISNQENTEFILPVVHDTSFEGTFTDAGTCDTHTAVWTWGDGTTSNGDVTETDGSGSVTNSHTYSQPDDYTITLTVTDDDGDSSVSDTMTVHVADVDEALDIFNAYIQSLTNTNFKNAANQRKGAFDGMFSALQKMWTQQAYEGMILSLNTNIRTKFDGLVGGSPKNDWIKQDLAIQTELCQKVDDITSYLEYLLSTMP